MPDTHLWRLIQSWMDGQIVRVNQAQLAEALGVHRQSMTQWKLGQSRPNPESLRALHRITRIDWDLLTDALLRDMGYVEEEQGHGTAITQAGESPATPEELEAAAERALDMLPAQSREAILNLARGLRPGRAAPPADRDEPRYGR